MKDVIRLGLDNKWRLEDGTRYDPPREETPPELREPRPEAIRNQTLLDIDSGTLALLEKFRISCEGCGSRNVTLSIDVAMYPSCSWASASISCDDCFADEELMDSG